MRRCPLKYGPVLVVMFALVFSFTMTSLAQEEIHMLVSAFPANLERALNESVFPAFEEKYGVNINLENVPWPERTERLTILLAAGIVPDIISTGYYSAYEEGAKGLLLPLDRYVDGWDQRHGIPGEVWESQRWNGSIYAIPHYFDLRAMAYHKQHFEEAGIGSEQVPMSWEELIQYSQILTRISGDGRRVDVRGSYLQIPSQQIIHFMYQLGVPAIDLPMFQSNLDTDAASETARFLVAMEDTRMEELPGVRGKTIQGKNLSMMMIQPEHFGFYSDTHPTENVEEQLGLFAPRRHPDSDPVALAFINGFGIPSASKNPDLSWALIEHLMDDEAQMVFGNTMGWMQARIDMADRFYHIPGLRLFYELANYIKVASVPPPRNDAQNGLNSLLWAAYGKRISPEESMMQGHELWSRLLNEWKESLE